ncbi:hypothetical protein BDZ89DRAFT_949559, partial [Hymenopellis radicata]
GPPTLPLIGNLHLFPKTEQWARQYGDVVSIKAASHTIIVLSSATAIREVVDKMGWIASSRPSNFLFNLCSDRIHRF